VSAAANASVFGAALNAVRSNRDIASSLDSNRENKRRSSKRNSGERTSRRRSSTSSNKNFFDDAALPDFAADDSARESGRASSRASSSRRRSSRRESSSGRRSSRRSCVVAPSSADIMREKQSYLIELQQLVTSGVQLSRPYTMADSLEDMQHEVYMHNVHADTAAMVGSMKMLTQFGLAGIEMLNKKIGPIVDLDGWSRELTRDMSKFDRPFTRIYRRFFKRGSMNPFAELGMIILGSMVVHVMRNKIGPMADVISNFGSMMPQPASRNIATGAGFTDQPQQQPTTPIFNMPPPQQQQHRPMSGVVGGGGNVNSARSEPPFGASSRAPSAPHVPGNPRPAMRRPPPSSVGALASALGQSVETAATRSGFAGNGNVGGQGRVVCEGDVCRLDTL
jgi:hypothetical protein